jgi:hypothetical protein
MTFHSLFHHKHHFFPFQIHDTTLPSFACSQHLRRKQKQGGDDSLNTHCDHNVAVTMACHKVPLSHGSTAMSEKIPAFLLDFAADRHSRDVLRTTRSCQD